MRSSRVQRNRKREDASLRLRGFVGYSAAMTFGDPAHDVQTQPGARTLPGAADKTLKEHLPYRGRYTVAVVPDANAYNAVIGDRRNGDVPARRSPRYRIGDQIGDGASNLGFVA